MLFHIHYISYLAEQKLTLIGTGLTDKIAKESSDSTASSHDNHAGDLGGNMHAAAHKANPVCYPQF
jgi:hypothetical protein